MSVPRAALVTGGSLRIGRRIVLTLAASGYAVAIHYRHSAAAAAALAGEVRALGVAATTLEADLADEAAVGRLIGRATAALGPLGVLVNNAGHFARDGWADATRASWDAHLLPNLRAPFVLTQQFALALPEAASGVVINLLDARIRAPDGDFVSYTVSKTAQWALTQAFALALAPRIRVNAVGPGPAVQSKLESAEQHASDRAALPLARGTDPGEIARAVGLILALPSLTGQMLALDGGQHLSRPPGPIRTA